MKGILIAMLITIAVILLVVVVQSDSNDNKAIQSACETARENARKGVLIATPDICF